MFGENKTQPKTCDTLTEASCVWENAGVFLQLCVGKCVCVFLAVPGEMSTTRIGTVKGVTNTF